MLPSAVHDKACRLGIWAIDQEDDDLTIALIAAMLRANAVRMGEPRHLEVKRTHDLQTCTSQPLAYPTEGGIKRLVHFHDRAGNHHHSPFCLLNHMSGHPVGKNSQFMLGLGWVVARQVDAKVVRSSHISVHHKLHRKGRRISRLKDHRTDGGSWRSTPRHDFNVRCVLEAKWLVANVR